jgi:hypothetical protein
MLVVMGISMEQKILSQTIQDELQTIKMNILLLVKDEIKMNQILLGKSLR